MKGERSATRRIIGVFTVLIILFGALLCSVPGWNESDSLVAPEANVTRAIDDEPGNGNPGGASQFFDGEIIAGSIMYML